MLVIFQLSYPQKSSSRLASNSDLALAAITYTIKDVIKSVGFNCPEMVAKEIMSQTPSAPAAVEAKINLIREALSSISSAAGANARLAVEELGREHNAERFVKNPQYYVTLAGECKSNTSLAYGLMENKDLFKWLELDAENFSKSVSKILLASGASDKYTAFALKDSDIAVAYMQNQSVFEEFAAKESVLAFRIYELFKIKGLRMQLNTAPAILIESINLLYDKLGSVFEASLRLISERHFSPVYLKDPKRVALGLAGMVSTSTSSYSSMQELLPALEQQFPSAESSKLLTKIPLTSSTPESTLADLRSAGAILPESEKAKLMQKLEMSASTPEGILAGLEAAGAQFSDAERAKLCSFLVPAGPAADVLVSLSKQKLFSKEQLGKIKNADESGVVIDTQKGRYFACKRADALEVYETYLPQNELILLDSQKNRFMINNNSGALEIFTANIPSADVWLQDEQKNFYLIRTTGTRMAAYAMQPPANELALQDAQGSKHVLKKEGDQFVLSGLASVKTMEGMLRVLQEEHVAAKCEKNLDDFEAYLRSFGDIPKTFGPVIALDCYLLLAEPHIGELFSDRSGLVIENLKDIHRACTNDKAAHAALSILLNPDIAQLFVLDPAAMADIAKIYRTETYVAYGRLRDSSQAKRFKDPALRKAYLDELRQVKK